jgi:hypothetical protein
VTFLRGAQDSWGPENDNTWKSYDEIINTDQKIYTFWYLEYKKTSSRALSAC